MISRFFYFVLSLSYMWQGASDFDADGDGHDREFEGEPGRDCDDTTDRISPSADDDWYDGVDQDCDDANDFDPALHPQRPMQGLRPR